MAGKTNMEGEIYGIIFDDLKPDEYGVYAYVCNECFSFKIPNGVKVENIPIDGLYCGVKGCWNDADFYLPTVKYP